MVVESDDKQIQIARSPRDCGDLLLVAVEHCLPRKREPITVPAAAGLVPKRGPDMVVESDDEQIQIAWSPRDRSDLLLVAVEHRLPRKREPITVPAAGMRSRT